MLLGRLGEFREGNTRYPERGMHETAQGKISRTVVPIRAVLFKRSFQNFVATESCMRVR